MTTATREKPILFSGPMVRAILDGQKTHTRRIVKPQPVPGDGIAKIKASVVPGREQLADELFDAHVRLSLPPHCPYGQPGTRLWVRETWASTTPYIVAYKANGECGSWMGDGAGGRIWNHHGYILEAPGYPFGLKSLTTYGLGRYGGKWRPSIHMPRWASRLTLEIKSVRVERVQEISEEDARAEGVVTKTIDCRPGHSYREAFADLWNSINGTRRNVKGKVKRGGPDGPNSWSANPWTWAIEFEVAK